MDLFIDINLPGYKIKPVAGDELCMVNLFLEPLTHVAGNQTTRKDVISQLRRGLLTKFDFYKMLSSKDIDILFELDKFLESPLTYYAESTSGLFLAALGNAYKVNIIVFQSDEKRSWICELSDNTNSYSTTLHFGWKFAEPVEDDDKVTIIEIIPARLLTGAKIKQEPNENDDDNLVMIKEIRDKTKKMKQESSDDEFVSYNGRLLL